MLTLRDVRLDNSLFLPPTNGFSIIVEQQRVLAGRGEDEAHVIGCPVERLQRRIRELDETQSAELAVISIIVVWATATVTGPQRDA